MNSPPSDLCSQGRGSRSRNGESLVTATVVPSRQALTPGASQVGLKTVPSCGLGTLAPLRGDLWAGQLQRLWGEDSLAAEVPWEARAPRPRVIPLIGSCTLMSLMITSWIGTNRVGEGARPHPGRSEDGSVCQLLNP